MIVLIAILLIWRVANVVGGCSFAVFACCGFVDFAYCCFADLAGCSFADSAGCCFVIFAVCCSIDFTGSYMCHVAGSSMVGQPMAFSMHPLDVDSWAKNGSDAQLESVLGLLAQVSEQDPKKLAEDVRSMSRPVINRMRDYPGTGLLEAWEAEALTDEDLNPTPKNQHIWIIRKCVALGVGVRFILRSPAAFGLNKSHP